jgi:nitric oxide reductase subunit B
MNIGLAWMVFVTLLPLGVLQLFHSVNAGYFEARSLGYITQPGNAVLEWMRLPGDAILIVGGVVPFCWIAWIALRHFRSGQTVDELPEHALYTSVATDATEAATQG